MASTRNEFVTRLQAISQDLAALVGEVSGELASESADFPVWAAEKVAKGICLECDQPIVDDPQAKRGLHSRCYLKVKRVLDSRRLSEATLIAKGAIAPKSKPGRKPGAEKSRIAELLASVDERPDEAAAAITDAAAAMQAEERRDKRRDTRTRPNKKTR